MSEREAVDLNFHVTQPVRRSSSLIRIAIAGLVTCIGVFAIDMGAIEFARFHEWNGAAVYLVFAVFIVQTALLGTIVGIKVNRQPVWWLFFGWTLILVNLVLILVRFNSYSWTTVNQSAFVYAFLTAQIGLVIFWGILGSTDWQRRIPVAFFLLIGCCYPYWLFIGDNNWLSVMSCYVISVSVTCALLRFRMFRLGAKDSWNAKATTGRIDQFGVKHLFVWMTIVAVLVGIGRLIPWEALASAFLSQSTGSLFLRALLMTIIIVVTAWAVLGERRGAWLRGLIQIVVLIAVGFVLGNVELWSKRSWLAAWLPTTAESNQIWITWTTLNGLFLAGLMLAIRMSGMQLARIQAIDSEA